MSRITKQIAEAVANQLILPSRQEAEEQETKLKALATEIYIKTIPVEIMSLFNQYPKYFNTRIRYQLREHGFNHDEFRMERYLPENSDGYYPSLSPEDAAILLKQKDKLSDLIKKMNRLKLDIETAVFNLRTYNNVEKEFPEAFKLLPTRQTTALIVNLKDIRCQLDKANC